MYTALEAAVRHNAANDMDKNGNGGTGEDAEDGAVTTGITDRLWSQFRNELESLDPESQTAVMWCISESLLMGYDDGTLRLDNPVTRAESCDHHTEIHEQAKQRPLTQSRYDQVP